MHIKIAYLVNELCKLINNSPNFLHLTITSKIRNNKDDFPSKVISQYKKIAITTFRQVFYQLCESEQYNYLKEKHIFTDIFLIENPAMQKINFSYRAKKEATDVIALAFFSKDELANTNIKEAFHLGEIYISMPFIKKEAHDARVDLKIHFIRILIHGLLHLLGYEHDMEKNALIMYNLEEKLLEDLNLNTNGLTSNYWR